MAMTHRTSYRRVYRLRYAINRAQIADRRMAPRRAEAAAEGVAHFSFDGWQFVGSKSGASVVRSVDPLAPTKGL